MPGRLKAFLENGVAATLALLGATVLALALANSPWAAGVEALLAVEFGVVIEKPLRLWINDGLMALFFLMIGLEIKREVVEGELSRPSQIVLPIAGAVGGMAVPAAVYVVLNWGDAAALRGWAIPSATDIAFSLGVLAALGKRVPLSLKLFLTTLAIVDDLGAIIVIALFYTGKLSAAALLLAAVCVAGLAAFNRLGVRWLCAYAVVGIVLWAAVLKSGVHATLAGVILAMFIPAPRVASLEHALKPWSAWLIMPVFAFANAGLSLAGLTFAALTEKVTLGIVAGLFVGKQVGIILGAGLPVWLGKATLPAGATWTKLYGVSILAGIGFTMSLFIGSLAFDDTQHEAQVRLGVLAGSLLSAVVGWLVLRLR